MNNSIAHICRKFLLIILVTSLINSMPSYAQFSQKGIVKEYNRREQKTIYKSPVEIDVKGASSVVSNMNGFFSLRFPTAHVGDTLSSFSVLPADKEYTLFNAAKIQDWILTSNREMEVLVCKKSIIDEIQKAYTKNYLNSLTRLYKMQLERLLAEEREKNVKLNNEMVSLREHFRMDSLEIVANSIAFAYVDESELDSLELLWRDCILSGNNGEAVRIGNEMNLSKVSSSRLENLNKSVSITQEMLEKTLLTARVLDQHIINLENQGQLTNSTISGFSKKYIIENEPYYNALTSLFGRLYELYSTEFRCSEQRLMSIIQKYAYALFKYANVCQRTSDGYTLNYTTDGLCNLEKSAELGCYDAVLDLAEMSSLEYSTRRRYIKRARTINDNEITKYLDWSIVDFKVISNRDTLYYHRLDSESEVLKYGENAVLLCGIHPSNLDKKLVVPQSCIFQGIKYNIKVLGPLSCNVIQYDNSNPLASSVISILYDVNPYILSDSIATTSYINSKTELFISDGIERIDKLSIGSNFKKITIPNSINNISFSAFPFFSDIDIKIAKGGNFVIKDGIIYSKDLHEIVSFVSNDIKSIRLYENTKFSDDCFVGTLPEYLEFPDSLRRFVVDLKNPYYKTINGILIDKENDSVLYIPESIDYIPIEKCTTTLVHYQNNNYSGDSHANFNKYITSFSTARTHRYSIVDGEETMDESMQFDYFMSGYCYGNADISIELSNGDSIDIQSYIKLLMPLMSNERLTFWGRTCMRHSSLECQKLGLFLLSYAKDKYGELRTDEKSYPRDFAVGALSPSFDDILTYHQSCGRNRVMALEIDPDYNYDSYIAENLFAVGDFDGALKYVNEAISKDSTSESILLSKCEILFEMGNYDDAIGAITTYIDNAGEYEYYGYYKRAFFYDLLGKYDLAIKDYSTSLSLNPSYAYSYLGRADMFRKIGECDLAQQDYEKVISSFEFGSSQCGQYALCMLGDTVSAKSRMAEIIKTYSNEPDVYYDAACLYSRMGEYTKSIEYLETAFKKGYRGLAHLKLDDDLDYLRGTDRFIQLMHEYFPNALP